MNDKWTILNKIELALMVFILMWMIPILLLLDLSDKLSKYISKDNKSFRDRFVNTMIWTYQAIVDYMTFFDWKATRKKFSLESRLMGTKIPIRRAFR